MPPPKPKAPPAAKNLHAVVGSDEGAVKEAARALAAKLAPGGGLDDLSAEVIDGAVEGSSQAADRIHQALDALRTPPFFGGAKLVWLKSATFLADTPTGRAQSTLDALEALADLLKAGLPPDVQFLISAVSPDKRRSFYKTLGKVGSLEIHDKLDTSKDGWEEGAAGMVSARADARGLRFAPDALELFTLFTGGDSRAVENELEKLDLWLGEKRREVRRADVETMTARTHESVVFELGSAIQRRDLPCALELVNQLLHQGEKAVGILLASIVPTVRSLLLVKDLIDRHHLPPPANAFRFGDALARLGEEATAHLPRKKDGTVNTFSLGFAAQAAAGHDLARLRAGFAACLETNAALVTGVATDDRVALEQLLVKLIG